MEVSDQPHAMAVLPPHSVHYPMYRRSGGPQSRSVRFGENTCLASVGIRTATLSRPVRSLVTILTELPRPTELVW